MNKKELKEAVIELLYELHSKNYLDISMLDTLSRIFKVDTLELCDGEGITYFID